MLLSVVSSHNETEVPSKKKETTFSASFTLKVSFKNPLKDMYPVTEVKNDPYNFNLICCGKLLKYSYRRKQMLKVIERQTANKKVYLEISGYYITSENRRLS